MFQFCVLALIKSCIKRTIVACGGIAWSRALKLKAS